MRCTSETITKTNCGYMLRSRLLYVPLVKRSYGYSLISFGVSSSRGIFITAIYNHVNNEIGLSILKYRFLYDTGVKAVDRT